MCILFTNGKAAQFTPRELIDLFRHPLSVAMLLLGLLGFQFVLPFDHLAEMTNLQAVFFWAHVAVVFAGGYMGLSVLIGLTGRKVISAVVLVLTAGIMGLTGTLLLVQFGIVPLDLANCLPPLWAFLTVLLVFYDFLFATFVVPWVAPMALVGAAGPAGADGLPGAGHPAAPPRAGVSEISDGAAPESTSHRLVISGEVFEAERLRLITAQEHFLRIVTTERTRFLRGRISDAETQLPESLGLRIHRSHWVAASAVVGAETDGASLRLVLQCGARVPVARGRKARVQLWLAEQGISGSAVPAIRAADQLRGS